MLNVVNKSCHIILWIGLVDSQMMGISGFVYRKTSHCVTQSAVLRIFTLFTNISFVVAFVSFFHQIKEADWESVGSAVFILVTFISFISMTALCLSALWRIMIVQGRIVFTVNSVIFILKRLSARIGVNIFDAEFLSFLILKLFFDIVQAALQMYVMVQNSLHGAGWGFWIWIIFSYIEHAGYSMLNVSFLSMLSIGQCFKLCAEEIRKILQKLDRKWINSYRKGAKIEIVCRASDEIDEIVSLWNSTYSIYAEVQINFSYQHLAIILCSYWDSVLQFYHAFVAKVEKGSQREEHPFLLEFLFGLCAFCQLTLFVLAASSSFKSSQRARYYLEQMLDLYGVDDRLIRNVNGHILGALLKESRVSVYQLFKVDKAALLQLFSTSILYLTIIIQFHKTMKN